jgi:hypothetical protein
MKDLGSGDRASDELEGKISQTRCVSKINMGVNLACFQSIPHRPLLAPIYIGGQVSRIGRDPIQITISTYDMNSYFD